MRKIWLSTEIAEKALLEAGYKKITTLITKDIEIRLRHIYGKADLLAAVIEDGATVGAVSDIIVQSIHCYETRGELISPTLKQLDVVKQLKNLCIIKEVVGWNPQSFCMAEDIDKYPTALKVLGSLKRILQGNNYIVAAQYETAVRELYDEVFDKNLREYFPNFTQEIENSKIAQKDKSEYLRWVWRDNTNTIVRLNAFVGQQAICTQIKDLSSDPQLVDASYINNLSNKVITVDKLFSTAYAICCALCDLNAIERILSVKKIHVDSSNLKALPKVEINAIGVRDNYSATEQKVYVQVPDDKKFEFAIYYDLSCFINLNYKDDSQYSSRGGRPFVLSPENMQIRVFAYLEICQVGITNVLSHYSNYLDKGTAENLVNWIEYLQVAEDALRGTDMEYGMQLNQILGADIPAERKEATVDSMDLFGGGSETKCRVTGDMSVLDMIELLAKDKQNDSFSDPDASRILLSMTYKAEIFKPADPVITMLGFDSIHVYGEDIVILVEECLSGSLLNLAIMFQMRSHGDLNESKIKEAISKREKLETPLIWLDKYKILRPINDFNVKTCEEVKVDYSVCDGVELPESSMDRLFSNLGNNDVTKIASTDSADCANSSSNLEDPEIQDLLGKIGLDF